MYFYLLTSLSTLCLFKAVLSIIYLIAFSLLQPSAWIPKYKETMMFQNF